jgi:hypothetical protein
MKSEHLEVLDVPWPSEHPLRRDHDVQRNESQAVDGVGAGDQVVDPPTGGEPAVEDLDVMPVPVGKQNTTRRGVGCELGCGPSGQFREDLGPNDDIYV